MSYIKYIQNEDHYKEVLSKAANVKESLWIGTADIKDLYVGDEPFLAVLARLLKKGKEVRLIHAKEPGPIFREEFEIVDAACNQFDDVWTGKHCKDCLRRDVCGAPIK